MNVVSGALDERKEDLCLRGVDTSEDICFLV